MTGSRIARDVTDASTPLAIIDADEIKLSGTMSVDKVLSDQPQFVQATNGGATANTVPAGSAAGAAYVNLPRLRSDTQPDAGQRPTVCHLWPGTGDRPQQRSRPR